MKNLLIVCITLLAVVSTGCSRSGYVTYIQPTKIQSKQRHAAVLPLVNLTTYPNAGRIVGDILETELYASTQFAFMERTALAEAMKGNEEDLEYVTDKTVARTLGKKLGVDTVIYGSVSEYRYKTGIDQPPAVGFNLRLLDVSSGEVLWASSISDNSGCWWLACDDSLNNLTQHLCAEVVRDMVDHTQEYMLEM